MSREIIKFYLEEHSKRTMIESKEFTRREFLKQFSIFAGTLPWISVLCTHPTSSKTIPSDRIRVGIIGIGSRGTKLLLHLQTIPEVEITAVCDDYHPHLYEGKRLTQGKAKTFLDYHELLAAKGIDAVVIATPLHLHAQMSCDALGAGKHVFCEKIMALTLEGCRAMVKAQNETGRILQIGFQRLFDVRYIKAIEMIREGKIGKITFFKAHWHRNDSWRRPVRDPKLEKRMNWRLYRAFSGGLMAELAAHQIQLVNWVTEQPPLQVMGVGGIDYWKDGREVYDNVSAIYSYPNGIRLSYTSILSNRHYGAVEQIMGTEGTLELETGKLYSENPPPSPGIIQLIQSIENQVFRTIPIGGASWIPDSPSQIKGEYIVDKIQIPSATQLELEAFISAVRLGQPIPELLDNAFNASVAALLGNQAMERNETVKWPEGLKI